MEKSKVVEYQTCVSTGPQHLNPDPERKPRPKPERGGEFHTIGEHSRQWARENNMEDKPHAVQLIAWAFRK
jgi:hypothetical protein